MDFAQESTSLYTSSVLESTSDSKAVNKMPSTWLKDPSVCNWQRKKVRNETPELSLQLEREQEKLGTHITQVIIQKLWGIQRYILIAQTKKKKPDCSSLPALPTAINTSRCQKMFQTCSDQPSFWWELLQLSQDKGPLCADKPFTHTSYSLPLKGIIEVLIDPEKMPGTTHTGRFWGFFPPKKNKVK